MKGSKSAAGSLGLLLALSGVVPGGWAQEAGQEQPAATRMGDAAAEVETITVTGRSVARGLQDALHEQPGTIHAITAEDIEKIDSRNTLDLIRKIPGVTAENYNQSGVAAAYSFRGFRLGHGIGAASYLDGIPYNEINNPEGDGYPDYNTVLPESIERLEVLKGLFSPRFGAYAQAGVLHFITKERGDYSKVKLQSGAWGYQRGVAEIAREKGRFFTYNAISADQGDGYRDYSDFHTGNVFSRFGYQIDDDSAARVTVHSYRTSWNAPGPLPQADWDAGDLKKQVAAGGGFKKKNMISLDYSRQIDDSAQFSVLGYGYESRYTRWTGGNNSERFDDRTTFGLRTEYAKAWTFGDWVAELSGGADYEDVTSDARSWNVLHPMTRERASQTTSGDFDFRSLGLYLQGELRPSRYLKLTLGGRYEEFDGSLLNNLTGVESDYSEGIFNPKGGILITPMKTLEIFANVGTGFVLPSGYRKFQNQDIEHAKLTSHDVGLRYSPVPSVLLQASFYRSSSTDEIIVDPVTLVEANAGEAIRQGVELSAEWYVTRDLLFFTNGASQDSEFDDWNTSSGDFTGNKIPRVPEFIGSAGIEYFPVLGWGGSIGVSHTGKRWNNNANTIREDAYTILKGSIQYALPDVTFTLFLNNLTDKQYSELRGAADYYPADPFNVTFSVAFSL